MDSSEHRDPGSPAAFELRLVSGTRTLFSDAIVTDAMVMPCLPPPGTILARGNDAWRVTGPARVLLPEPGTRPWQDGRPLTAIIPVEDWNLIPEPGDGSHDG